MDYIVMFSSVLLFLASLFLLGYNTLYAVRTGGVNKKLGLGLSPFIKRLFFVTIVLSFLATVVTLGIFTASLY